MIGIKESDDQYHGRNEMRGGDCLSSHGLIQFMRSPLAYRMACDGQGKNIDTDAFAFGRAAHTYILEGEAAFRERYAVGGPVNPKTGECYGSGTKAFAEWRAAQGKPCLTHEEAEAIRTMNEMVQSHELAASFLLSGDAEMVYRGTMLGKQCQIKTDWIDEQAVYFVDLKTCRDIDRFRYDFRDYMYDIQLAFYQWLLVQATGILYRPVVIAVEKSAPYRCAVYQMDQDTSKTAANRVMASIIGLNECQRTGEWKTGYEEIITI